MVYFFNLCCSNREKEMSEKLLQATVTLIPFVFFINANVTINMTVLEFYNL